MSEETIYLADVRKFGHQFPTKVRGTYREYNPDRKPLGLTCPRCLSQRVYDHAWQEEYQDNHGKRYTSMKRGSACLDCWHKWEGR